jgi:nucleotide-binding universal stress UspA family protein
MTPFPSRNPSLPATPTPERFRARPVMLATLDVPFDLAAAEFGVDAAVESGAVLIVVNVVETPFLPGALAGWDVAAPPEVEDSLSAPSRLAHALGVEVERLRVRSPHPVDALLQVAGEREAGVLVFGPDRTRLPRRRYRKAERAVRERAPCLVWTPEG